MISFLSVAVISVFFWLAADILSKFQKHLDEAKASGFTYIVGPASVNSGYFWTAVHPLFISLIRRLLPFSKNSLWLKSMNPNHSWAFHREIYDAVGSDTWFLATPGQNYLATTDAALISQITGRRNDFEKPIEVYAIVDMFGPSMLTLDGAEWRRHRKIIAPAFSEKSNTLVWEESLRQAEGLVEVWGKQDGNTKDGMKVEDTANDTLQLALHVISGAGFGVPQLWPGQNEDDLGARAVPGFNTKTLTGKHKMPFLEALHTMVNSVLWMAIFPIWMLELSPFSIHKKVISGFREMGDYFLELADFKLGLIEKGEQDKGTMDLMGPLVKATERSPNGSDYMTKNEVTSNSWIFLFAGHETSANMLHFSLLFLAINRGSQENLQEDIDCIAENRPSSQWSYAIDMRRFYNSMVGAVQMEVLRLMPPVADVPKVTRSKPQDVEIHGKKMTIPADTFIHLDAVNTQRNPKYYPNKPSVVIKGANDLDDFIPERWLLSSHGSTYQNPVATSEVPNSEQIEEPESAASFEASGSLYTPPKGAFLAFSDGPRACPGRRFAQVEITAVIAFIFSLYSVELDVGEWASDEQVTAMNHDEKKRVYAKAQNKARKLIRESNSVITLKMHDSKVPIRVVRRGLEMFKGCTLHDR